MTVPVPCYLVEWYHSAVTEEPLDDTVARLKDSAVLMSAQGSPVRLLNLLAVPTAFVRVPSDDRDKLLCTAQEAAASPSSAGPSTHQPCRLHHR